MSIQISDPLQLLPYQTGLLAPPLEDGAARGQNLLTVTQRSIVLGEPVPIVFCRRVSGNGGVFVSPGATEGRYENNATTNQLTVNLELVLSEGDLPQLEERDLYQRNCRVGTWAQTYNRRAGTWTPGNFIVAVVDKEPWSCPQYCGTSGTYADLTTLSYTNTHQDGDDTWDKQVHAFVREGIQVTRILDNTLGSSNNVVDLAIYLIKQSSRLPDSMLDMTAFTTAANFTNVNSFFYNGEFKESTNLEDWLQEISSKFLLRVSDNLGKKGLRPLLPINNDYTIKTTAINSVFTFTEDQVLPDGFQIEYIPLSERKSICALILWRQQPDSDVGIVRTSEVRFTSEATDGPYEQYDLSQFCTTENHAIKVGTYYVARRKYITHTLRLQVRPDTYNSALVLGDIVRVRLQRETTTGSVTFHDFYYEVERISKSISGIVELDLMHFPVDSENRSLVARAVAAAAGAGYVLPTGRNDFSCNVNNDTDAVVDTGGNLPLPDSDNYRYNIPAETEADPSGTEQNSGYPESYGQITGNAVDGNALTAYEVCPGAYIEWYRCPKGITATINSVPPVCEKIQEGSELFNYTVTTADIDFEIVGIGRCPDPSTPTGLGSAFVIGTTDPVEPDILSYAYVRWNGQLIINGSSTPYTSSWNNITSFTSSDFLTVGPLSACSFISNVGFIAPGTDSRFSSVPAIGPIAWRAQTSVTTSGLGPLTGEFAIGGLASNGNANNTCAGINPAIRFAVFSSASATYAVTGKWEFSNDASTVLIDWEGRAE